MIEGAVRTGTFMNRGGVNHQQASPAMIISNNHHGDYKNPNSMMLLVVACAVLLCIVPSVPLVTSAFVATPLNNHRHDQFVYYSGVGNSPEFSFKASSRQQQQQQQQPWTIVRSSALTNNDDSIIVSTRRRGSQRTVARASAMDSSDVTTNSDPKRRRTNKSSRTRPKIRQTTTTTLKLRQQQLPMQDEDEEQAIKSKVVVPEYRRGNKSRKKKKKSSSEFSFYDALMKDHEILTSIQELKLGRAVQRAKPLQLALERLMQEKRIEQQQLQLQQLNDNHVDDNDDDDDYEYAEDRDHCDVSNFSFAWERREELEKASWLAWQEGDDNEEEEEEGRKGDYNNMPNADDTLLLETLMAPPPPPPCNNGDVPPTRIYISDEDIIRYMNLPGGRAELQSILWNGIVARDTLIRSNIRLVVSIAKKWALQQATGKQISTAASYYNTQYLRTVYLGGWDRPSLDEAVQEGIVGLAEAVQRYDPSRNLRFATYATFWITNSIRKCFQSASTTCLRVPASYHDIKSRFNTLVRDHHNQMGGVGSTHNGGDYATNNHLLAAARRDQSSPSLDVLANELGITKGRLQRVLRATKPLLSLDQPRHMGIVKSDGGDNQMDLLLADSLSTDDYDNGGGRHSSSGGSLLPTSMEQGVELSFLRRALENCMATELAPYERDIVRLRLGLDDGVSRTAKQVVAAYGGDLSVTDVRLAEKRAFSKLRSPHALSTYKFLAYLDFAGIDKETATLR